MKRIANNIMTIMYFTTFAIGFFFCNCIYAQDNESKIDEYIRARVDQGNFSGSVLVAKNGSVVACRSYGMANYEYDTPNSPQTKFQIGSMTKSFTAMAIMLLEKQGLVSFDDYLDKYLADFPGGKHITIHHLLTHTAGIPKLENIPDYKTLMIKNVSLQEIIKKLYDFPLEFTPGENYSYSNSGYMVLALIIEKVTEKPFGIFLKEHIFDPLGMKNTVLAEPYILIKNRASGYTAGEDANPENADYENLYNFRGPTGIYSTVEDLYLWDRALYTGKLLDTQSLERAFIVPEGRRYGYGWVISDQYGHKMIWHDGSTLGFQSYIARFPDDDACIIILSNFIHAPMSSMRRDLAAILFDEPYELPTKEQFITVDPSIYDLYIGKYRLENDDIITITKENDRLFGEALSAPMKFELFPIAQDKFSVKIREGVGFTFNKDNTENYTLIILHWGPNDIHGQRIE